MKAEYAKIVDGFVSRTDDGLAISVRAIAEAVAARCEALANKPVRELTDEECQKIWIDTSETNGHDMVRQIVASYLAKQQEPEEIAFDQAKLDEGGWEVVLRDSQGGYCAPAFATKVTLVRKQ